MEPKIVSSDLIEFARSIDLYARRYQIIFALDVGEFDKALDLCRGALSECEMQLKGDTAVPEKTQHAQNLATLQSFEAQLRSAAAGRMTRQLNA